MPASCRCWTAARKCALRVYERDAGETLACGTGACAAVVAGIRLGWLDRQVDVQARGGLLTVEWAGRRRPCADDRPGRNGLPGRIEL
jgi:diaminopimelate epimerase